MPVRHDILKQLLAERPHLEYEHLHPTQARQFLYATLGLMYPHFSERSMTMSALEVAAMRVEADLREILQAMHFDTEEANRVVDGVFGKLPQMGRCLRQDAEFINASDPAAKSFDEVVLAYPGFLAIAGHRLAKVLYDLGVPNLPRLISEHVHERTGIDIHPGAYIGCPCHIDHGTGMVIGETANIGKRVKLYQGVTLGALSVDKSLAKEKRHPTIEDDVVIYANATVLGGDTVIGRGSVIGGNVWITQSVEPDTVVLLEPPEQSKRTRRPVAVVADADSHDRLLEDESAAVEVG